MTEQEQSRYDAIVHALRMKGWSRFDAEGEALERIDFSRQRKDTDDANR